MGVDTQNRPQTPDSDANNPGQQHADKVFNELTSKEHLDKDGVDPFEKNRGESDASGREASSLGAAVGGLATSGAIGAATSALGGPITGRTRRAANFFLGSRKRKAATIGGGSVAGLAVGGAFLLISMLLPLKVINMVENLENHFFASSEQATEDLTEHLMQQYLVRKVMPGMVAGKCNSTRVNKSCALVSDAKTPVGQLFDAWRTAKFENKMATKYGFEIIKDGNDNFYVKSPNISKRISLGHYTDTAEFDGEVFARLDRADVRREARVAVKGTTYLKPMMHRFQVGKLLESKYDVKRCILACKIRDAASSKAAKVSTKAKRAAFQSIINERVVGPRQEMYSLAIDCALSSFSCASKDSDKIDADGNHSNEYERDLHTKLSVYREKYGSEGLDDLFDQATEMREKGIANSLIEKITEEAGVKISSEAISKGVPVIGWIDLAASIEVGAEDAGPAMATIGNTMYQDTAVSEYMVYRTSADEIHTGKIGLTEVGSVANSLNAVKGADQGGLSAEQSKLWGYLNKSSSTTQTAASLLVPSALAADTGNGAAKSIKAPQEDCNDGSHIPADKPNCSELIVGLHGALAGVGLLSSVLNSPMYQLVVGGGGAQSEIAHTWVNVHNALDGVLGDIVGALIPADALSALISKFPYLKSVTDNVEQFGASIIKTIAEAAWPNPLGDFPSGARNYEVAAGGVDFANAAYAHDTIGGHVLTDQQAGAIQARADEEEEQSFASKSLYAKMFDTNDTNSVVSQVALGIPNNLSSAGSSTVASLVTDPLHGLFGSFASLFNGQARAATGTATGDPFGITQYGLTDADIASLGDDYDAYWDKNCSDISQVNQAWGEAATQDSSTGEYDNYDFNGCKAIQSAIGPAGGFFDPSLLPEGSTNDDGSDGSDGTGGEITVASYNMCQETNHACGQPVSKKTDLISSFINDHSIDIVGAQELSIPTQNALLGKLSGWKSFPDNVPPDQGRAILWNGNELTMSTTGNASGRLGSRPGYPVYSNSGDKVPDDSSNYAFPWVRLQDTGGNTYVVLSTHSPNDDHNRDIGGGKRASNARAMLAWSKDMAADGSTVIITGDFNVSGTRFGNNSPYCILTADGSLQQAHDLQDGNPKKACPTPQPAHYAPYDSIFVSTGTGLTASKWNWIASSEGQTGTDHSPAFVTLTEPGGDNGGSSGNSSSAEGWQWPIAIKDYTRLSTCWNAPVNLSNGAHGSHAGLDISVPSGTNVYAAHDGTVVSYKYNSAGGNTLLINAGGLWYNYQHLKSSPLTAGATVKAGQLVAVSDTTGANVTGPHLHFGIATAETTGSLEDNSQTRDPLAYLPKDRDETCH